MRPSESYPQKDFECDEFDGLSLPAPPPLEAAIAHGVFGYSEAGSIVPSEADVESITREHARDLISLLVDLAHLQACAQRAVSPVTEKPFRTSEQRETAYQQMISEAEQLIEEYEGMLAAYEGGFGSEATEALDTRLRNTVPVNLESALPAAHAPLQQELF